MGLGVGGGGSVVGGYQPESDLRQSTSTQVTTSCPLPQDYELFVEAVEQNTLQEFLKLA